MHDALKAVHGLSPDDHDLLWRRYMLGDTYRAIAADLDHDHVWVWRRIRALVAMLEARLDGPEGGGLPAAPPGPTAAP